MIEKKHNRVYLIDDNSQDEITIDLSRYYCDINFRIKSNSKIDTFVKIGKEHQAFDSLNSCFNSIMEQYENEPDWQKQRYIKMWFVDKYNKAITFYCNNKPLEECDAFVIRKCVNSEKEYFELAMYYIKGYSSFHDGVLLTTDYGRYTQYIPLLVTLHNELMAIAQEKEEPQPLKENQPTLVVGESELEEPRGIKKLIKTLFKR